MQIQMLGNTLVTPKNTYRCSHGKNGCTFAKVEGDGKSPVGVFPLRRVFYRADKVAKPKTGLPVLAIAEQMGWCDDSACPEYNTLIELPFAGSHEKMWRDDDVYDLVVEIGYNDDPVVPGKGSAIFMHCARDGYSGTEGCVALGVEDLLAVLAELWDGSTIEIKGATHHKTVDS